MAKPKPEGYRHRQLIADAKRYISTAREKLKAALYESTPRAQVMLLTLVALSLGDAYEALAEMQAILDDPANN